MRSKKTETETELVKKKTDADFRGVEKNLEVPKSKFCLWEFIDAKVFHKTIKVGLLTLKRTFSFGISDIPEFGSRDESKMGTIGKFKRKTKKKTHKRQKQ